ncbi:MAG TPA: DUF3108 domain-containing protein [Terriglobales bacterium]|jgi:hypothetical protein|nr:DUF3108 domain-containing protein [Terriglobales bacterium]
MDQPKLSFFVLVAIVLGLIFAPVSQAGEAMIKPETVPAYQPKLQPFERGEKEIYRVTWNGMVSVATAEIHTIPTVVDGRKVYHVRVEAKSSPMLDLIWKMRDTISSTFDAKALAPSKFTFNQRENSKIIDTEARFDQSAKRWAVNRQQVGKRAKIYQFESNNTLDPITAVYLARSTDFKIGDKLYFKIFGGRYQYLLELLVEGKEPVMMESGKTVDAYRIIPRIQNITKNGYAERLNEAVIWISADERRLPIKLSSKITFGTVYMEVVSHDRGTQSTAAEGRKPAS